MSENLTSESEATSSKKAANKSDEHNKITKSILESATISIEHWYSFYYLIIELIERI
jgi:hypothetical protein